MSPSRPIHQLDDTARLCHMLDAIERIERDTPHMTASRKGSPLLIPWVH